GNQHRAYFLPLGTRLVRLEHHPENLSGPFTNLLNAPGKLDASALAPAPRVDLRLHHEELCTVGRHLLGGSYGLVDGPRYDSGLYGDSISCKDLFCLVLVQLHMFVVNRLNPRNQATQPGSKSQPDGIRASSARRGANTR